MSKMNDGGPAFPNVPEGAGSKWDSWDTGMTLRDYFAAKAMVVFIEKMVDEAVNDNDSPEALADAVSFAAYAMADGMLARRAK